MIDRLDHLVLTVRDLEATCQFYERALGMQVVTFGNGRKALHFGAQKSTCMWRDTSLSRKRDSRCQALLICA